MKPQLYRILKSSDLTRCLLPLFALCLILSCHAGIRLNRGTKAWFYDQDEYAYETLTFAQVFANGEVLRESQKVDASDQTYSLLPGETYQIKALLSGTSSQGYLIFTVGDQTYYSDTLKMGESLSFTITLDAGLSDTVLFSMDAHWGEAPKEKRLPGDLTIESSEEVLLSGEKESDPVRFSLEKTTASIQDEAEEVSEESEEKYLVDAQEERKIRTQEDWMMSLEQGGDWFLENDLALSCPSFQAQQVLFLDLRGFTLDLSQLKTLSGEDVFVQNGSVFLDENTQIDLDENAVLLSDVLVKKNETMNEILEDEKILEQEDVELNLDGMEASEDRQELLLAS